MVGTRLGPYEIVARIGAGGMGEVFRARDTRLGRDVAIKVLPPELAEDPGRLHRFEQEAKATAALAHPNVLALYDVGTHHGKPYLVEELLEGETLRTRLRAGPLGPRKATEIAIAIAHGLAAAHAKGIVHRDLKPENVFLTKDGGVKILDFGLARLAEPKTAHELATASTVDRETGSGAVLGTLGYHSPEQARGQTVDARSDLFAFGCLLHEMLAGERPFQGDTPLDLVTALLKDDPPALPTTVPAPLRQLVLRCLEKQPEDRFSTAHDLALALGALAETSTTAIAPLPEAGGPRRRRPGGAVVGAAALLTVAILASFWVGRISSGTATHSSRAIPRLQRLTWEAGSEALPSISPDGSSFVYAGKAPEAQVETDIFYRRVGGETAVNLTAGHPGLDTMPTFSPDGQKIAFRSSRDGGGIFVMGATGESLRRLTDFGFDPDWSPDGRSIVFAETASFGFDTLGRHDALWSVDATTGVLHKVLEGDGVHPTWSPSGGRIAFDGTRRPDATSLMTIAADGSDLVEVLADLGNAQLYPEWSPGWIWYWYLKNGGRDLWRVPVDDSTGRRTGEAEPVTLSGSSSWAASASSDGSRVLFTSYGWGGGGPSLSRAGFDSFHGKLIPARQVVARPRRAFWDWVPSPDGAWLASNLKEDNSRQDLVLTRIDSGETLRLTDDDLKEGSFAWSPSGPRLLFALLDLPGEIWSLRVDGSGRERVVSLPDATQAGNLLVSPDGRWLYLELGERWLPHRIDLTAPLEERRPVPLPSIGEGRSFSARAWSPDGRWLAGYPLTGRLTREPTLVTLDLESDSYRETARLESPQNCAWLPDSRRILLLDQRELRLVDRVTGSVTPAGTLEGPSQSRALAPDGRWVYFNWSPGESDIWMLDYGRPAQ